MLPLFRAVLAFSLVPAVSATPLGLSYRHSGEPAGVYAPEIGQVLLRQQPGILSAVPCQEYLPVSYRVAATPEMGMTTRHQVPPVLYPRLSKTLDSLAYVDQWPQQRIVKQLPDSVGRDLAKVELANFARHQPLLEQIVRQYGYPGLRQVGAKSASNFWLLVQHADAFPTFQRQVLKLMLPEVQRKNADPSAYAYLTDRVARNTGQLSEYGTQVVYEGSGATIRAVSRPLRDPAHVNQRRTAVGLEPLKNYLNFMTKMTREMNAPKAPANSAAPPTP